MPRDNAPCSSNNFVTKSHESNLYVIACGKTREAALIDAGTFDPQVVDYVKAEGLKVRLLLLTHSHWDHTDGLMDYTQAFRCQALSFNEMHDGHMLKLGTLSLKILHTTGHTDDSISILVENAGVLFTGDALFAGSIGGTSSARQKAEELENIKKKILTLPEQTIIYSGHGPATSVAVEKKFNPFLQ